MAASEKTISDIYDVLATHITRDQMKAILPDLLKVKGNASFTETIRRLAKLDEKRKGMLT